MEKEQNNDFGILKRYRLIVVLVVVLMIIGIGCWFVKKRDPNKNDSRNDGLLRQLNQKK